MVPAMGMSILAKAVTIGGDGITTEKPATIFLTWVTEDRARHPKAVGCAL